MRYKTAANQQHQSSRQDRIALTRAIREALASAQSLAVILDRQGLRIDGLMELIEGLKRTNVCARMDGADMRETIEG